MLSERQRRFPLALTLTLGVSGAIAAEPVFRIEDDSGVVMFSDMPPGASRTAYRIVSDNPIRAASVSCLGVDGATLDERAARWRERIRAAAARHALEPALLEALIRVESCFDPDARSVAGAQGLTQLMPTTAQELGVEDPFDADQNLDGGARYLARMLARFGDETLALAAYNAGPGTVERYGGVPPFPETQGYLERIATLRQRP